MNNTKYKILVVDDEQDICDILKFNLENEGYDVTTVNCAEEALKLNLPDYDLVLLDVMMEGISGFQMAKKMKDSSLTRDIPIIFLSARNSENDAITGLTIGADDYIAKPFSLKIVTLKIKAVLGRKSATPSQTITFQGLHIDTRQHKVIVDGEEATLTKKEYEILKLLVENRDQVFTREEILGSAWDDNTFVLARTVDVNITRLRKKIGNYGQHIATCQGYGYKFSSDSKN